jgi:hypothetical protein
MSEHQHAALRQRPALRQSGRHRRGSQHGGRAAHQHGRGLPGGLADKLRDGVFALSNVVRSLVARLPWAGRAAYRGDAYSPDDYASVPEHEEDAAVGRRGDTAGFWDDVPLDVPMTYPEPEAESALSYDLDLPPSSMPGQNVSYHAAPGGFGPADDRPAGGGPAHYGPAHYGPAHYDPAHYGQGDYGLSRDGQGDYGLSDYGQGDYGNADYGQANYASADYPPSEYRHASQQVADNAWAATSAQHAAESQAADDLLANARAYDYLRRH